MTQAPTRALAPDIARGFMLLMIAVANVSVYLWGRGDTDLTVHPTDGTALDRALSAAAIVLVDARIYPMFAFLFGYGIVQFMRSRAARGVPARSVSRMLLRRHLWLVAFGFVHALLLFAGDILGAYGLAGLLLVLLLGTSTDRAIRIVLWVLGGLLALGVLAMAGVSLLLNFLFSDGLTIGLEGMDGSADDPFGSSPFGSFGTADMMAGVENFWLAMLVRVGVWIFATPGTVIALTVPACMLLGMLAGRHGWLEGAVTRIRLASVAGWGILIGALGGVPSALQYLDVLTIDTSWDMTLLVFSQFTGMFGGVGYAALFALLARRISVPPRGLWGAVAAVGKRSLSFYLLQSLVFAPLLSAWGFGLGGWIGTTAAFAIAVGVWVLSLIIAGVLEQRGARGPAEVLLRRLTYGNLDRPSPVVTPASGSAGPGSDPTATGTGPTATNAEPIARDSGR
ncbi:DUF418 domain-containing protein [Leucobacter sp. GX24907]